MYTVNCVLNHFCLPGNFCPLCNKCYDDDDLESKLVKCRKCDCWVHAKCERLTGKFSVFTTFKYLWLGLTEQYSLTNVTKSYVGLL